MRNLAMFALIFIPLFTIIFMVYVKMFKKHAKLPMHCDVPPPLSRRLELLRLRAEVTTKLTELHDVNEIKELTARLNSLNGQIQKLDDADAETKTP